MNGDDVVDTLAWNVGLTAPATSCTIDFGKTIAITTPAVSDDDGSDNTANRSVVLVVDTDTDGHRDGAAHGRSDGAARRYVNNHPDAYGDRHRHRRYRDADAGAYADVHSHGHATGSA